jgi:membrane protein required for colicin V production
MNLIDFIVLLFVAGFALTGALRGFLREAIGTIAWMLALLIAWHFGRFLEPQLGGVLAASVVRTWAARVIIVALVLLIGAAIGTVLAHFVPLSLEKGLDSLLGLTFGVIRGVVMVGVFVLLGQLLRLDGEHWWRQSALIPYGESVADGVRVLVGEPRLHHKRLI